MHWVNKSIQYPAWCCWLYTHYSYSYTVTVHVFCQGCGAMVWHSWKHSTINKADLTVCCKLSNYLKSIVIVHWVNEPNTCQFDRMRDAQLLNVVAQLATLPHTTHDKDQVVYIKYIGVNGPCYYELVSAWSSSGMQFCSYQSRGLWIVVLMSSLKADKNFK